MKKTGLVTFMTLAVELLIGWAVAQDQPRKSDGSRMDFPSSR